MAYEGYEVPIALGALGLRTDGPQSQLPPNAAIVANNVSFFTGILAKSPGTAKYNTSAALGASVVAGIDWWPTSSTQRMIVATSDGNVWKDTGDGTFSTNTALKVNETQWITFSSGTTALNFGTVTWRWNGNNATGSNNYNDSTAAVQTKLRTISGIPSVTVTGDWTYGFTVVFPGTNSSQPLITTSANTLSTDGGGTTITITVAHIQAGATGLGTITTDTHFVAGGAEVAGNSRRLFIFSSGTSQVAMITGDGGSVTGITRPAADWTSYPTFGVIYNNRLVAFGNSNAPHTLYISKLGDHTDFTTSATDGTGASTFPVFPGEGDGLLGGIVFKGALLLFKRPFGMYMFQWNGGALTTPGNVSITKLSDNFTLGSPHALAQILDDLIGGSQSGSIFSQKATNAFGSLEAGDMLLLAAVRNYFRSNFDPAGIQKMHAVNYGDKFLGMFTGRDVASSPQNRILMLDMGATSPRISVESKDQPTCLFMRKDTNYVPRPYYGANDGFVYKMDQSARNVNGVQYTGEFQTPYTDFSYLEPKLAEKNKIFDFLAVTYQPTGNWSFYVDVWIDGVFVQTLTYIMKQSAHGLDSFVLDSDKLGTTTTSITLRQPLLSCTGKALSIRIYNDQLNQDFAIERVVVSFRESGEQNMSSKS